MTVSPSERDAAESLTDAERENLPGFDRSRKVATPGWGLRRLLAGGSADLAFPGFDAGLPNVA
jgi:hypothetical protein